MPISAAPAALLLALVLGCGMGPTDPVQATHDSCDPVAVGWDTCVGQPVYLQGAATPPSEVMSHPSLSGGPSAPAGQAEAYLSVDGQQVPFLTTDALCTGPMTLRGTLTKVELGGAPGTRGSYSGYAVPNATITCL